MFLQNARQSNFILNSGISQLNMFQRLIQLLSNWKNPYPAKLLYNELKNKFQLH